MQFCLHKYGPYSYILKGLSSGVNATSYLYFIVKIQGHYLSNKSNNYFTQALLCDSRQRNARCYVLPSLP